MKKILSILVFGAGMLCIIILLNPLFVDKKFNRYYILSEELKQIEDIDVQVYGSCHAYSSFNTLYFTEETGVSSYCMANPGEIMPASYLRIKERLKNDIPKVVVVETWGVNAYETYLTEESIFEEYFGLNVENIPFSKEKLEVINRYDALDLLEENFYIAKYKDRLLQFSIDEIDFDYSYEKAKAKYYSEMTSWLYDEMENRLEYRGFDANPFNDLSDYPKKQAKVSRNSVLEVEEDMMYYVEKIIELCDLNDTKLIFYRAPYRSTKNELRKENYLDAYFEERGIPYYNLEEEIEFDYKWDFLDYEHLSRRGAQKATEFLMEKILLEIE